MSDLDEMLEAASDLREIRRLASSLRDQAYHKSNDREFPGGDALVALGPVAQQSAWDSRRQTAELAWWNDPDGASPEDRPDFMADEAMTHPLQLLLFWSEAWRAERGVDKERLHPVTGMYLGPTLWSEAKWLAKNLNWIYETEPHWDDFTKDVHQARTQLEALLREGERQTKGIICPHCRSVALVRTEYGRRSHLRCEGHGVMSICPLPKHRNGCVDTGGLQDEWTCPKCGAKFDQGHYDAEVLKDYVANAPYLPAQYVERRTNIKPGTVKVWAHRGYVRTEKDGRDRTTYCIEDIEARLAEPDDVA